MKRHNLVNRQIQYTLPNISRSKDNQAKRGTQNVVEKLFPDPFRKGKTWAYLWINSPKFYTDCFYFMTSWGLSKQVEIKLQTTCFYLIYSLNKKQKKISPWFLKKNISLVTFYKLTKFHCLVAFTLWEIGQYVYCNDLLIRLWH